MNNYIIGGWTQRLTDKPPEGFSYTMYGMITELMGLTAGTAKNPGWSPMQYSAPSVNSGKVLWTYGGGLCSPNSMPESENQINKIVDSTVTMDWSGVDFDDECEMNIDNLLVAMKRLKPRQISYSFIAGWNYNNPTKSEAGKKTNIAIHKLINANLVDRYILMCYGEAMWSETDIKANVASAIHRTISIQGVAAKKVILALTPIGLTENTLAYFLDQVIDNNIGGLFIWNFPLLKKSDLETHYTSIKYSLTTGGLG